MMVAVDGPEVTRPAGDMIVLIELFEVDNPLGSYSENMGIQLTE
jgi:hypothetical protein